ncbi:hypothetical protein ACFYN3_42620 [Streptomyces lavendulae]|uniref:hypothetical protein n=1 Tax=Streptomyces lavendulae TaxID=1914 RepID=UPI0036C620EF
MRLRHTLAVGTGALLVAAVMPTTTADATDGPGSRLEIVPATANTSGTTVGSRSDLEAVRLDPDPALPGGTTEVHAFVVNLGPERTASPFQVTLRVPNGLTILRPQYPNDCVPSQDRVITCTFPPGLNYLETATAIIPVRVDATVPAGTTYKGCVTVAGNDDTNRHNNRTPITFTISDPDEG